MRKLVLTTLSALALMTGAAAAQSTSGTTATPPSASPQGAIQYENGSASSRPIDLPGNASVDQLMDRTVLDSNGERVGKVSDVILGDNGQAQLLIVQSGGFLGIGAKDVAIDMALAQPQSDGTLKLQDVTQASIRDMPEFQYDDTMTSLNRGGARTDTDQKSGAQDKQ